jgi:DNA-directed RNA polymerase specialized sigma24 family protein
MTDRILIEACIANDRKAQHQLYERYKSAMYTLAYRITADFELAGEALQDGFRQAFVLVEIEGWSHAEIADFCGISESTSRSQLFHAKKRLRAVLSPVIDQDP